MDIRGLGEANIRKFYDLGLLKDVPGIYKLDFKKIGELEGFGQRSIDNLQTAIESSKKQPLHRLIFGLGIRFIGETSAKTLAHAVNHLFDFKKFSLEDLQNLEDVGPRWLAVCTIFLATRITLRCWKNWRRSGCN
jgi:DNA ligase (NAD+)